MLSELFFDGGFILYDIIVMFVVAYLSYLLFNIVTLQRRIKARDERELNAAVEAEWKRYQDHTRRNGQ